SKEFLSGELLSVEGQFNHYIITLQSPQPVDTSLCTHCGLCIGVCSEGCINNDLAVDLTKCSFCGKCQQVCPEGAIDLHRYSEERIETAQLVVDDALQVKLPEDRRGIFSINDLKGLFRNIGDYQVEELLFHSPSICQYHRGFDLGCKRCLQVCPSGAIKKGKESLEIDSFICTGCGRCVSVCPTGAVQYVPFNDEAFIRYLTSLSPRGYTLVIAKEEELRGLHFARLNETHSETLFIEHPCPEALGRFHFLALFAYGVRGVYTELNPEASFVNALLKELYGVEDFIRPFSIDAQFRAVENPLKEPLRIGFSQRHVSLAELMNALVPEGRDIRISDPSDLFSDINCDTEGCTLCLACVNVCSAGAMRAEEKDFSLRAYPPHCINCSLCVEVCPEGVLSLKSLERLNREFFQERLLAQDEPLRCKRCGKVFGNRKVYDEVVRRLTEAGLFAEKGRFLHLCEDCRVIALFEGSLTEG
ncbi:MAG: 4Fe-4S dicluster domain-containing protein, partial [Nitrospirae bacterium]